MIVRKNPYCQEASPGQSTWVSYLLIRPDNGVKHAMDDPEQTAYADHLTTSTDWAMLRELKVRVAPVTWFLGLTFVVVEGVDADQALATSIQAALGGLAAAKLGLDSAQLLATRLAEEARLREVCSPGGPIQDIRDRLFSVDATRAEELFEGYKPLAELGVL